MNANKFFRAQGFRVIFLLGALIWLSGCTHSGHYAPVAYAGTFSGTHYIVHPGDTLYSIAFRFGLDYKSVAKANRINPPYTIFVRQKIRIAGIPPDNQPDSKPDKHKFTSNSGKIVKITKPLTKRPVQPPTRSSTQPQSKPKIIRTPPTNNGKLKWIWPLQGKVVKRFSLSGNINKGIDIGSKTGGSVVAAAGGVVVYAGGGLRGYGKLVIVKHNERYLSAYGNNDKLLVKEGKVVKAGDKLAKISSKGSGKATPFLHFEIRRDGKPQNPIGFLPRATLASYLGEKKTPN